MRKLNEILLAFAVISLFAFTACNNASSTQAAEERVKEEQKDVQEAGEDVSEAYQKESTELREDIRDAQNKIDKRLTELRAKLNDASADAKVEINQQIERLETKRVQLASDLDRVGDKVKDGWDTFKENVKQTIKDAEEDLNRM